jgi:hypothetical protein
MRIVTNQRLAKRNRQFAQYSFFASFIVPLAGLLLLNQQTAQPTSAGTFLSIVLPFLVLPLAYGVMIFAIRLSNLWVREPRPEAAIEASVKGLGNKAVLYNYVFFPARHVIFSPQGVFAIITRFQDGSYSTTGRSWVTNKTALSKLLSFFRQDRIGDPTTEAERAAAHISKLLQPIAPNVPVQPLIIFVDPRVHLEITDPVVPVLHTNPKMGVNLKDYLRDVVTERRPTLTTEQIAEFERRHLPSD